MKNIYIFVGGVIILALGVWYQYNQGQAIVPIVPIVSEYKSVTDIISPHAIPNTRNIAFSELRPGKNDFNGVLLELFDLGLMKNERYETSYIEDVMDCSNGCNTLTDYYFSYAGEDFKISKDEWESGGTAGRSVSYELFVFDKEAKKWGNIKGIHGKFGFRVIGYKNYLILSGSYYNYHTQGEDVFVYDIVGKKLVSTKQLSSNFHGSFWLESLLGDRLPSLYSKDNKLFVLAPKDKCYFLTNQPTYVCSNECGLDDESVPFRERPRYMYTGCVSGYYPAETASESVPKDFFNAEYMNEAAKYDQVLKTYNWGTLPAKDTTLLNFQYTASSSMEYHREDIYHHPAEWLSPLLGRTLNMSLAGEDVRAWEMFKKDFAGFSKQYPLTDPVDPVMVERDLRNMLLSR